LLSNLTCGATVRALRAIASTRGTQPPSDVRARLAAYLVDAGAVRSATECLQVRVRCHPTDPAAVALRVAAAGALLEMAAVGRCRLTPD
jgi:hypothetical protein